MEQIIILGNTLDEIIDRYFDSVYFKEAYTIEERNLLKQGFREGIEYLYPLYDTATRLNKIYEKLEQVKENTHG